MGLLAGGGGTRSMARTKKEAIWDLVTGLAGQ